MSQWRNVVLVIIAVSASWAAGALRQQADLMPSLAEVLPEADNFLANGQMNFAGTRDGQVIGFVQISEASGYGGPLRTVTTVDTSGVIRHIDVLDHKETPSYYRKFMLRNARTPVVGEHVTDVLQVELPHHVITGATMTAKAWHQSVLASCRTIMVGNVHLPQPPQPAPEPVNVTLRDIIIILLFALGFSTYHRKTPGKKLIRWIIGIASIILLGFVYTVLLNISNINALLLGYLPDWRSHLSVYLLLAGVLVPLLLIGKSPYCSHVCPFGAVQDCLQALGGNKISIGGRIRKTLARLRGAVVLAVVCVALYFRNPGLTGYEVFNAFFDWTGDTYQFILLVIVVVAALVISRPWCHYLCPVRAVTGFMQDVRSSFVSIVKMRK
jgi:NosR/NirI family transcriptional regulator, nitrous oxide reductase regulator